MAAAATLDLLSSVGLSVEYVGTVPHRSARWAETLSLIGLGGKIRGLLILSMPADLVLRSHPTGGTSSDDLGDWLSELANLLLGKLKCQLIAHGVAIELSTPLTLSATAFRFERFTGTPVVHEFRCGEETLHVVFEAIAEPDLRLMPKRAVSIPSGEMISF